MTTTDARGDAEVVLVVAPFHALPRPALGTSTLQAVLAERGIRSRTAYYNFDFAERMDADSYQFIAEHAPTSWLLGEWVFSPLIGLEEPPTDPAYIEQARHYCGARWNEVLAAREIAARFVEETAQDLAATGARIVGFSTTFQQNCSSLAIARRLKELAPDIAICFGGANCDGPMGAALLESFAQVDYVFRGEADRSFPDFAERYLEGRLPYSADPDVLGWIGLSPGEATAPLENLDVLPVPDFSDYFLSLGRSVLQDRIEPAILFESSRGCWWGAKHHCTFCGLNGSTMAFRTKSPKRVLSEIDFLHARWGVRRFEASDNIMNSEHIEAVFGELSTRPGPGYRFFYEIKSNMRSSQLSTIARGGVTWVQPGIESLDDGVLRLMEKGVSGLANVRLLRTCAELGMHAVWNLLFGFPGEKLAAYEKITRWFSLMEHLEPPRGLSWIRLDRFSPYYERSGELGFTQVEPAAAYRSVYNLPVSVLSRLAYFFDGFAPQAIGKDEIEPLRSALAHWQKAQQDPNGMPMLVLAPAGPIGIIRDTRSVATEEVVVVDEEEMRVLRAYDDPASIVSTTERLAASGIARERVEAVTASMIERHFLLVDGAKALNIVCDGARDAIDEATRADYPGGYVRERTPAAVA